jgi:hypothetical protein
LFGTLQRALASAGLLLRLERSAAHKFTLPAQILGAISDTDTGVTIPASTLSGVIDDPSVSINGDQIFKPSLSSDQVCWTGSMMWCAMHWVSSVLIQCGCFILYCPFPFLLFFVLLFWSWESSVKRRETDSAAPCSLQLPFPDDDTFEQFNAYSDIDVIANNGNDVSVCCPNKGIPTQCSLPQPLDNAVLGNIYLVCSSWQTSSILRFRGWLGSFAFLVRGCRMMAYNHSE